MKKSLLLIALLYSLGVYCQVDSTLFKRSIIDTIPKARMNMDAVYDRPFITMDKLPVAVGGYMEADYRYIGEDGVTDGHSFRIPRMTLFFASSIHRRIKFLSELELEEGGKEIAIEFAALDIEFHPLLNLRGGIVMNPIGAFNQNHDSPKWDFVDRPTAMVQMLPATWSNVGFGLYGKQFIKNWAFGYEVYLTNGFDQRIIENDQNKTYLPASKSGGERFEENSNGHPLFSGKLSLKNSKFAEIGISYMGGPYNKYLEDGIEIDEKRMLNVLAFDFNSTIESTGTYLVGEWAWIFVDVPGTYTQQFGNKQVGGFVDIIQPLRRGTILGFENASINLSMRLEYVDWNKGTFSETDGNISDDLWAITPGMSFRPTSQTVVRLNYTVKRQQDILGNPPAAIGGILVGIASYF